MAKVVVIGAVGKSVSMDVDKFHVGGETIFAKNAHTEFGGKGFNRAIASARQNVETVFIAACGAEDASDIESLFANEGARAMLVKREGEQSDFASIITDAGGTTHVTVFQGAALKAEDVAPFADEIASAKVLVLDNEIPEDVNVAAAEIASAHGVKIILNPAPYRPLGERMKELVDIYTPNEFETQGLENVRGEVVGTLGAKGCAIRSSGVVVPAVDHGKVVDTTGAGDTFNGVLAARLSEGEALEAAALAANDAAGIEVTRRYVLPAIPYRNEMSSIQ
jgi:ribokinase